MEGNCAPIAFFAFNRPTHTARSLAALAANPHAPNTDLFAFVDGPRTPREREVVDQVLTVVEAARNGFRRLVIVAASHNQGLFLSITRGVSNVLDAARRVIVVEDDILVSPHFLAYMNAALDKFQDAPAVGSIHAYAPPIPQLPDYFFLRGADCWGWATWADRWALFRPDAEAMLHTLQAQRRLGEFTASHGSRSLLYLLGRVQGRNQSWAILWHASLFLAGRLTLHSGRSFVRNIGNDGSGAHSVASDVFDADLRRDFDGIGSPAIVPDRTAAAAIARFLDVGRAPSIFGWIKSRILFVYSVCAVYRFHVAARLRR